MAILVEPATLEHDAGVTRLFNELSVAIDPPYWDRAFSPENPNGDASIPLVAVDETGSVIGFAAARPIQLHIEGQDVAAQVLHDFVVQPGAGESDISGRLMQEAMSLVDLTLVAGAGLELARVLDREHLQRAAMFARWVYDPQTAKPDRRDAAPPLPLEIISAIPSAPAAFEEELESDRRVFRRRSVERLNWQFFGPAREFEVFALTEETSFDGYVAIREVDGRAGREMQVVDWACPHALAPRLAKSLARLSEKRKMPLYISLVADELDGLLVGAGFVRLRARWPLFWILRDPRQRAMGTILLRSPAWFFSPSDGEIDHW